MIAEKSKNEEWIKNLVNFIQDLENFKADNRQINMIKKKVLNK